MVAEPRVDALDAAHLPIAMSVAVLSLVMTICSSTSRNRRLQARIVELEDARSAAVVRGVDRDAIGERELPLSAISNASARTGSLMTLALLNASSARTAASSPVVRCFTHTPALPGNRASSASSSRCSPLRRPRLLRGGKPNAKQHGRHHPRHPRHTSHPVASLPWRQPVTSISRPLEQPMTRSRFILEDADGDLWVLVERLEHSREPELHRLGDQERRPDSHGQRTACPPARRCSRLRCIRSSESATPRRSVRRGREFRPPSSRVMTSSAEPTRSRSVTTPKNRTTRMGPSNDNR